MSTTACDQGRRWRRFRCWFRRVRICILLLVFLLVAAGGYLNEVGLPDFVKQPLLNRLQARGVDIQVKRIRLRWYRGVVAEDVRFGPAVDEATGPRFLAREVELRLNHAALTKFQLNVDSLILHDGELLWALGETNATARPLYATNIQAQLRFLTNDLWELDDFTAAIAGVRLRLSASLTNASYSRDWKIFHPRSGGPPGLLEDRLRTAARILERLKFAAPPDLAVTLHGDARNAESFHGLLTLNAPGAETPWGTLTNGALAVRLTAAGDGDSRPSADVQLRAQEATTDWTSATNFHLHLQVMAHESLTNLMQARLEISADALTTRWAQTQAARLKAEWTQSPTNSIPLSGTTELHLAGVRTRWGRAGTLDLEARLNAPAADASRTADASWAWWAGFEPYSLDWTCRLRDIRTEDARVGVFEFKELACAGGWRAPELTLTNAHAELYRGRFDAQAALNVATRTVTFDGTSSFDAQKALPLLTGGARKWLEQYSWVDPPRAHGAGTVVLPGWTNRQPDWRGEVLPTLQLRGDVTVGEAAFREVPVSSAAFHFTYSNMIWNIPDLVAERPEGRLELTTESDDRSKLFHFRVHSTMDPGAARRLLPPQGQRGLGAFIFTQPPVIDAELWGRWHHPDELGLAAAVTITNFALRGESATYFHSRIQYTNDFVIMTDARLEQGAQYLTASGLGVDPAARKAWLTNGFSTLEPAPFFRVIGPKVTEAMAPYHFRQPPTVHASGTIPLSEDLNAADLHFTVDGGPFNWMRFNLDHISGGVYWVGPRVTLTNVQGTFYQGTMAASAQFDFSPHEGADFSFDTTVTDADLHALIADLSPGTNHLEGRLTGELTVSRANSTDRHSWNGGGQVDLRNGLLWDVPVFGIFSPVLDAFQKGWGESRADRGSATFSITNSVIHSDDLLLRAPAIEMWYQGTVDFAGRVHATVQARLLRETPLFGPILTLALSPFTKLFEYEVTGTLSEPQSEPRYKATQLLLMPFNPVQTLRQMMPAGESPGTNAPPPPGPYP